MIIGRFNPPQIVEQLLTNFVRGIAQHVADDLRGNRVRDKEVLIQTRCAHPAVGPNPKSKHIGPMMSSTYDGYRNPPFPSEGSPAREASSKKALP